MARSTGSTGSTGSTDETVSLALQHLMLRAFLHDSVWGGQLLLQCALTKPSQAFDFTLASQEIEKYQRAGCSSKIQDGDQTWNSLSKQNN